MRKRKEGVADLLTQSGATFSPLAKDDVAESLQRWCELFASEVMKKTGAPVYRKIRWHAFSFSYSPHVTGIEARSSYYSKAESPLCVLDEYNLEGFWFTSTRPIDFSDCGLDLYVYPEPKNWTIVFTHEQPQIGPFYRERLSQR